MDIHDAWQKALRLTEIKRSRVQSLMTFQDTPVPYILLSESAVNLGDTVVRQGEVLVERPSLILPPDIPQFDGFELKKDGFQEDAIVNFLLIRGIHLPSLKYNNQTNSLDIFEGNIGRALNHYHDRLQRMENVQTGLITGPEDVWQFSLLIYVCSQVARNLQSDIKKLLERYKKND